MPESSSSAINAVSLFGPNNFKTTSVGPRVAELTDWRRQVREHKRELVIGAAIVGFAVGGLMALRRR